MKTKILSILLILSVLTFGCVTGCQSLKPVPIAASADSIVVTAERVQSSSLAVFKSITEWELANRAVLPKEVTAAVDKFRVAFPPAWRASRKALADYKLNKPANASIVQRSITALQAATTQMLLVQSDPAGVAGIVAVLNQITNDIETITRK